MELTMDCFNTSLKMLMQEQKQRIPLITKELFDHIAINSNDELIKYLRTLEGFMLWHNVPNKSMDNILSQFKNSSMYGERIGFIDSGLIIKKGKVGILFCEQGLVVKGLVGSAITASYSEICRAVFLNTNKFISEDKFQILYDPVIVIEGSNRIIEIMEKLQKTLIDSDKTANKMYFDYYDYLLNAIIDKSLSDDSFTKLIIDSTYIYAENINDDLKHILHKIDIIFNLMKLKFDKATKIAIENNLDECIEIAKSKEIEYHRIKNKEHTDIALIHLENNEYSEALDDIKQAIFEYPELASMSVYLQIILDSASEKNLFQHDELQMFINQESPEISEILKEVIEENTDKIETLNKKYNDCMENLTNVFRKAIQEEDTALFDNYPYLANYSDKYGMNALMYAVLMKNKTMITSLVNKTDNMHTKNLIGHECLDINAFISCDFEEYMQNAKIFDEWIVNRIKKFEKDEKKEKCIQIASKVFDHLHESYLLQERKKLNEEWRQLSSDYDCDERIEHFENRKDINKKIDDLREKEYDEDQAFENYVEDAENHYFNIKISAISTIVENFNDTGLSHELANIYLNILFGSLFIVQGVIKNSKLLKIKWANGSNIIPISIFEESNNEASIKLANREFAFHICNVKINYDKNLLIANCCIEELNKSINLSYRLS